MRPLLQLITSPEPRCIGMYCLRNTTVSEKTWAPCEAAAALQENTSIRNAS